MSLTRKFLKAMGIEDEKIDEIISAHSETVDALKDKMAEYKDNADKLADTQKELEKLKTENANLKQATDEDGDDSYKSKYEKIKKEYDDYKKSVTEKESKATKEKLYTELLKNAGVNEKRIASVLKVSNLDNIEIDKDGKLKDADNLTKSIKEEWADFIVTTKDEGANVSDPPNGSASNSNNKSRAAELYKQHYTSLYGEQKGNDK